MIKENNIFLAGSDALVYLAEPMHKKHLFEAIHLACMHLMTNFSTPSLCRHLYTFWMTPSPFS